jgi:hypothetical protein
MSNDAHVKAYIRYRLFFSSIGPMPSSYWTELRTQQLDAGVALTHPFHLCPHCQNLWPCDFQDSCGNEYRITCGNCLDIRINTLIAEENLRINLL